MSAAWVLAAHRSARQRPDRPLGPQGADAIRRALSPDRAGRRPLDGIVAVGDRPRAVGLRAGLDPSHPVVAVQGVGLCALAQAVGSISGGWAERLLVLGVPGQAEALPADAAGWRFELADEALATARLITRHRLAEPALLRLAELALERAGAAPHRPRAAAEADDLAPSPGIAALPALATAALLLADDDAARRSAVEPRARIIAAFGCGVDPADPLPAIAEAARGALQRSGRRADELAALAVGGRHAAVEAGLAAALGCPDLPVNAEGGPLARGHAGPAEGLCLLVDLLDAMEAADQRFGLVVEPGALGQAWAVVLDREAWA